MKTRESFTLKKSHIIKTAIWIAVISSLVFLAFIFKVGTELNEQRIWNGFAYGFQVCISMLCMLVITIGIMKDSVLLVPLNPKVSIGVGALPILILVGFGIAVNIKWNSDVSSPYMLLILPLIGVYWGSWMGMYLMGARVKPKIASVKTFTKNI